MKWWIFGAVMTKIGGVFFDLQCIFVYVDCKQVSCVICSVLIENCVSTVLTSVGILRSFVEVSKTIPQSAKNFHHVRFVLPLVNRENTIHIITTLNCNIMAAFCVWQNPELPLLRFQTYVHHYAVIGGKCAKIMVYHIDIDETEMYMWDWRHFHIYKYAPKCCQFWLGSLVQFMVQFPVIVSYIMCATGQWYTNDMWLHHVSHRRIQVLQKFFWIF